MKINTAEAERLIGNMTNSTATSISNLATSSSALITQRLEQLNNSIKSNAGEAERSLAQLRQARPRAQSGRSAQEAERTLTGMSTGVSNVIKQNANEVERTLLGVSAEVARNFVGKADDIATAVSHRSAEMTRFSTRSRARSWLAVRQEPEFADEVSRVTDQAVKAIEAKGFTFTRA